VGGRGILRGSNSGLEGSFVQVPPGAKLRLNPFLTWGLQQVAGPRQGHVNTGVRELRQASGIIAARNARMIIISIG
jgi:hypothetical protein